MSNVFKRFTEVVNKPNRAPYDLSFQNNLTMKFGKLYPVFCKEVLPGDSFKIQPTFNFNFMPLVSPVQTRMKATLHFFYVRNRPQWKDFMDWDGMTKDGLTPPYIKLTEQNRDMVNTGEIGDFFGIPTKVYGAAFNALANYDNLSYDYLTLSGTKTNHATITPDKLAAAETLLGSQSNYYDIVSNSVGFIDWVAYLQPVTGVNLQNFSVRLELSRSDVDFSQVRTHVLIFDATTELLLRKSSAVGSDINVKGLSGLSADGSYMFVIVPEVPVGSSAYNKITIDMQLLKSVSEGVDSSELELSQLPWVSDNNPDGLRINAFPFRAYEAIYNSFYRDERNNPRMVNGQPEYNKYITTDEGGADTTHYKLFQRNWEPDYLTTAVQSPQQGVAPLVGITSVTAAGTIEITDGNGVTYTAQTKLAEDGDTIQGIRVLSENSPTAVNRALVDLASTGISISDLRNVNALQRWLEINMRRGLRYRDQVKSHYGVDIEFKELQMPEFIGGVNEDVIVNRISQTVETEDNPLGSLAGQAGVLGTSKHKISHYCDEKGFIIGIFSIAPVPNYSQNLPKHMIKTSQLDYFTPEFAHIGMQPILNSEVTPLQANLEGKLNDVFGYQRPWYEYLASTDEVHGQFRDTMRRYLINRVYDGTPELGSEFLTIDPDTINDVFAVTEDTDKIYGQIWFDVTAKRPIASNVTPRIEP